MRFCDYCGDELLGNSESIAFGHSEGHLRSCTADAWFYYCAGDCAANVKAMLRDLARFSNVGEGPGLHWRLVDDANASAEPEGNPVAESIRAIHRVEAKCRLDDSARAALASCRGMLGAYVDEPAEEEVEPEPEPEPSGVEWPDYHEYQRRCDEGTPLHQLGITSRARTGLRRENLVTLEEVVTRPEADVVAINGVGPHTMDVLREAMAERGLSFSEGPPRFDGKRLRMLRDAAGLSQWAIARQLEPVVSGNEVCAWENGRRMPTPTQVEQLARMLSVSMDLFQPEGV